MMSECYVKRVSRVRFAVFSNVFTGLGMSQERRCGMRSKMFRYAACIALGIVIFAGHAVAVPAAAGGDSTYDLDGYRIHVFTTSGTLNVNTDVDVDLLVVAGGGGGGKGVGGGGGAGGLISTNAYSLTSQSYTVTVGGGGATDVAGSNSSFGVDPSTAAVGGGESAYNSGGSAGSGGSGGGGALRETLGGVGTAGQGNNGGDSAGAGESGGGGGGGAGAVGQDSPANFEGGNGGSGWDGSAYFGSGVGASGWFAGGGGGGSRTDGVSPVAGTGHSGGGNANLGTPGDDAQDGTGSGGGGGCFVSGPGNLVGGSGGSGIVIVRYVLGVDTNAPIITVLSPTNNATGVLTVTNLVATFDEPIVTNTIGSILITNLSDNTSTTIAIGDTNQVTVSGTTLTITPTNDLELDTSYAVLIDTNALMDTSGNFFAGITDDTTWAFTILPPDTTPPSITTLFPENNATGVRPDSELVATFDEVIVANTTGSIVISNRSDNSIRTIAIGDTSQITVNNTTLTITPPVGLVAHTSYAVLIDTNALKDTKGNFFAGIPNAMNWWFDTGDPVYTVAYWVWGSSTTLTDISGSDQSLTGASSMGVSAVSITPNPVPNPDPATTGSAGSIYFNGSSLAPKITGAAAEAFKITSTSSFTFEGWLKSTNGVGYIAGDRHNLSGDNGWSLFLSGSSLQFYAQTGTVVSSITGTTNVQDDTPHHYAVVWDHAAGYMRLYIDGTLQGTASHTPTSYTAYAFAIGGGRLRQRRYNGRQPSGIEFGSPVGRSALQQCRPDLRVLDGCLRAALPVRRHGHPRPVISRGMLFATSKDSNCVFLSWRYT